MTVVVRQKAGWEVVKFIRSRCSNLNWIEKLEWGRSLRLRAEERSPILAQVHYRMEYYRIIYSTSL